MGLLLLGHILLYANIVTPILALCILKYPSISSKSILPDMILLCIFMWNVNILLNPKARSVSREHLFKIVVAGSFLMVYGMLITRSWMIQENIAMLLTFSMLSYCPLSCKLEHNILCYFMKLIGGPKAFVPKYSPVISTIEEYKKKLNETGEKITSNDCFNESNTKYCSICWENPVDCVLLPCKHVGTCHECIKGLKEKDCPFCRRSILQVANLFFC